MRANVYWPDCWPLEERIAKHVAWYEKNHPQPAAPKKESVYARRQRRERESGPGWTKEQWLDCVSFFGSKCLRCGDESKRLVPDHITPLKRGGRHELSNIQPLCQSCNLWKGLKIIDLREGLIYGSQ